MSDDRFKQARQSLIDRHNQRQQQQGGNDDSFDDDFEDEATAMVNLDGQPVFAPPPNFAGEPEAARTEMYHAVPDAPSPQDSGVQMRSHSGVQPSYDSFGGQGAPPQQPQQPQQQHFQPQQQHFQPQQQHFQPAAAANISQADPNQSLVIGPATDFEENTAFINLSDFAQGGENFTPDDAAAGYEGNTQFVNIAELQASGPAAPPTIDQDPVLKQAYQFGPESIQQGEFALIFAQNHSGQPVILKRIWEGDPNGMPIPVRQRVAALDAIRHPQLVPLTGMVAAPSGAWVELSRPPGYRLTDVLQSNGPQDPNVVLQWIEQVANVLEAIHQNAFTYSNLTTDAIWIQEDGSVLLEPFDVLSFEQRGNLGAFGPPELSAPPDQVHATPATDVYSLAAVMVAALTGVPVNLGAVQSLEKKTGAAITAALQQDPTQRPAGAAAFVAALSGKKVKKTKPGPARGADGEPAGKKNKMKVIIPAVVVLGVAGVAAAFFLRPTPPPAVVPVETNNAVIADPTGTAAGTNNAVAVGTNGGTDGSTNAGTNAGDGEPTSVAAGDVVSDPRLTITMSYKQKPSVDGRRPPNEADLEEAAAYRAEAREKIDDIEGLASTEKRERYTEALEKLAFAVRLSGEMTAADDELLQELSKSSIVKDIKTDYFERLDTSLKEERISSVKQVYPQLASVDSDAKETKFFVKNKAVDIVTIKPIK